MITISFSRDYDPQQARIAQIAAVFLQLADREYIQRIAAAGNDAGPVNYPAAWGEMIAVGAMNRAGELTEFYSSRLGEPYNAQSVPDAAPLR